MSEVGDAVLGTQRTEFAGGGRREDGLIHKVDKLEGGQNEIMAKLSNGGLRITLHPAILAFSGTVLAAIIGGIATILVKVL